MTISRSIHVEVNKFLNHLDKQEHHGFTPDNIKMSRFKFHHSRDSAIMMCSLVNLIRMDKVKFTLCVHVFLNYLHFEEKVCRGNDIPEVMYNENGTPILSTTNNAYDYDVLAFRMIAICQIVELFRMNKYDHLIDDITMIHDLVGNHLKWITQVYKKLCYDIWGNKFGVHYCNIRLYYMALTYGKSIFEQYYQKTNCDNVDTVLIDLKEMLSRFDCKSFTYDNSYQMILPSLKTQKTSTNYDIEPSVLIPYLPIFGQSRELIRDKRLINIAMTCLSNNNDLYHGAPITKNLITKIPFVRKYSSFTSKQSSYSVLCTMAVYNIIISMNSDVQSETVLHDWDANSISLLKRKIIDRSCELFEMLSRHMSDTIDKLDNSPVNYEHENLTRMLSSCCMMDMLQREDDLIKNNRIFGTLSRMNRLIIGPRPTHPVRLMGSLGPKSLTVKPKDTKTDPKPELINKQTEGYCSCNVSLIKSLTVVSTDTPKVEEKQETTEAIVEGLVNEVITDVITELCNNQTIKPPKKVTIESLMTLCESVHCFKCNKDKKVKLDDKLKNMDMKKILNMYEPLKELSKLKGLDKIKDVLIDNISYFMKKKNKGKLLHIAIMGPPGVGKTVLANIIAKLYKNMGILSKGHVVKVTRSDLIDKYVGHTAPKTEAAIEKAKGGILFIDEAYSLVDREGRDSFSKACIDTLTQHLLTKCDDMVCIIAGYKVDIEKYFFGSNEGLIRRFPFKFHITGYTHKELCEMFIDKMTDEGWVFDKPTKKKCYRIFRDKAGKFKNFGGDVENLVYRYGIVYNRVNFFNDDSDMKVTIEIINKAMDHLFDGSTDNGVWKRMYI